MRNAIKEKEIKIFLNVFIQKYFTKILQHSKSLCHTVERRKRLNLKDKESAQSNILQSP